MASYLERYLAGGHEQVWRELMALGDGVRDEPVFADAYAVERETMGRVRRNVERLILRLRDMGYSFSSKMPLADPIHEVEAYIATMEEWGPLPLALRAFYEVVGEIELKGELPEGHPWHDLISTRFTPCVVAGLLSNFDAWMEAADEGEERSELAICDDPEGIQGAFYLEGPLWAADAPLMVEGDVLDGGVLASPNSRELRFVDYLRGSLSWAGFPSLAYTGIAEGDLASLVDGFEPF
jgi:hypothetical protein